MARESTPVAVSIDSRAFGRSSIRGIECWYAAINLKWVDRSLNVFVISHQDLTGEVAASQLEQTTARALESNRVSAFETNVVVCSDNEDGGSTANVSAEVLSRLEDEYRRDQDARKGFYQIRGDLRALVSGGNFNDARQLLMTFERFLDAGESFATSGWNAEKLSGIHYALTDLQGRKNRNHENYKRRMEYIRSNLSAFSPPFVWVEQPPAVALR